MLTHNNERASWCLHTYKALADNTDPYPTYSSSPKMSSLPLLAAADEEAAVLTDNIMGFASVKSCTFMRARVLPTLTPHSASSVSPEA